MYDPYPYHISKLKISILVLSIIILSLVFLALQSYPDLFSISGELIHTLVLLKYLLLIALFLFSWKTYSLLLSREYLFLSGGIIAFLLIQMFFDFYIALAFKHTSLIFARSLFWQMADFLLFLFLMLAAFQSGKILSPDKRKAQVYRSLLFALVMSLIFSAGGYFLFAVSASQPQLQTLALNSMRLLNGILLITIGIKYIHLYLKSRHNIYFWFLMPVLFFIFAIGYSFPHHAAGDIWEMSSMLLHLVGFATLIWTPFVEHTRFMEAETKLRKSLEKSLFQSEQDRETYSSLVNTVAVGICTFDETGKLIFVNERLAQLLGFSKERLVERNVNELFDTINLEKFEIELEKLRSGISSQFEIELVMKKNQRLPVMISAVPVFDLREKFTGGRMVIFAISSWKEFERRLLDYSSNLKQTIEARTLELEQKSEQLKQAKTYYETLISGMLDILLVIDNRGNCSFINHYGKKLLGYSADELKSSRLPDFFTDLERLRKNYGDAMKVELRDYEAEVKTKEGQRILCSWNVRYLFDSSQKNIGAMCVGRDITEQKMLRAKLDQHTQHLEKLVAERTNQLNANLEQLSKILRLGEEITLNIDIGKILTNICQAIKNSGWRVVILSLKKQQAGSTRIVAYAGIAKGKIRDFVAEQRVLFENTFQYLRDEFRISQSFLVRHVDQAASGIPISKLEMTSTGKWQANDALIIPIRIKEKILGFVNIFEPIDKKYPGEQQIQLLEIFVHKAAVAIENRRLLEEKTKRAQELARVNQVKSEYFTRMSHELRTPLNSIITLTGVLLKRMSGELNAEQTKQIQIIQQNGESLLKLINNILDMSKIEAGRMEINYTYFSLADAMHKNIEAIRPLCERKKLKLELKLDKKLPEYIFSDQDKISQVMTNILGNAVKFTKRGKIIVAVKPEDRGAQIHFAISDTGIGIDPEEISKIYQSYQQLEHADRPRYEGTGLGLAIARQLWTLLGGSISVESKKDKGTTFHLVLPLKKEMGAHGKLLARSVPNQNRGDQVVKKSAPQSSDQKSLILLVEDNPDNQYAVKFILEDHGYRVVFARDGAEGVQKAIKLKPDLILMDMMMPKVDGYQATQKIRSQPALKNIPIIAMTAKSPQEDNRKAIQAGCNEYLSKPFNLDDILKKVEKWIG